MYRLGILGSTRGTNLLQLVNATKKNMLPAEIKVVVSNKIDALILQRAQENGIPAIHAENENKMTEIFLIHKIDLIVLIGYMRILSDEFVNFWQGKIINVHPSLLPAFAGLMNENVHRAVLASGVKESGCTVHEVISKVDAGKIIIQKKCSVMEDDTVLTLKERVQKLEGEALIEAIMSFPVGATGDRP